MKLVIIAVAVALLAAGGCQWFEDTKAGVTAPLAEGERSPLAEGQRLGDPIKSLPLPFAGPIGWAVGLLAGLYLANRRGAKLRAAAEGSDRPISGWLGQVTHLEQLIQTLANLAAGVFEIGPDGSVRKRSWKAIAGFAIPALALMVPGVRDWVTVNADSVTEVVSAVLAYLGIGTIGTLTAEKALSVVKPLKPS